MIERTEIILKLSAEDYKELIYKARTCGLTEGNSWRFLWRI